jgi:hypothetical protein
VHSLIEQHHHFPIASPWKRGTSPWNPCDFAKKATDSDKTMQELHWRFPHHHTTGKDDDQRATTDLFTAAASFILPGQLGASPAPARTVILSAMARRLRRLRRTGPVNQQPKRNSQERAAPGAHDAPSSGFPPWTPLPIARRLCAAAFAKSPRGCGVRAEARPGGKPAIHHNRRRSAPEARPCRPHVRRSTPTAAKPQGTGFSSRSARRPNAVPPRRFVPSSATPAGC